jgi:monoamine oxidase
MKLSRRTFLQQSLKLTAGAAVVSSPLSAFAIHQKPKVLIIGAGFAGLSAAYHCHLKGIPFEVIESRDRVGGRVFSYPMMEGNQLITELGAEWIGNDHSLILKLCDQFGIPVQDNQLKTRAIYKGRYHESVQDLFSRKWSDKYSSLLSYYRNLSDEKKEQLGRSIDPIDWWRYLYNAGCTDTDLELHELMDSTDFGESIRHVSAYAALDEYAKTSEGSINQMDKKMTGGNQTLARKMMELFPDKVHSGVHVLQIIQNKRVQVICKGGRTFEGDRLICTVPTLALKKMIWQPALPSSMLRAIDQLQYARINKHATRYSERFWKDESFDLLTDTSAHYFYHATKLQTGTDKGVLISYTIGDKAAVVANQSDAVNAEAIRQALKPAFGDIDAYREKQSNYYWGNDAYSLGAYAFYGKGQWFELFEALNQKHHHTIFAGEHLSENWQGFMEGALETGRDAVEKI